MSYVLAFLGFAALIILHEAGHFVAAKAVGMRVERFSLFFGPMLVKFKRGETEYGIGPIPAGGYVKITGMNPNEKIPPEYVARAYYNQRVWKRVVVILAGPAVNLVIAFVVILVIFTSQGQVQTSHGQTVYSNNVEALAPPASNFLKEGDRIVAVDGKRGLSVPQITKAISSHRCSGAPTAGCTATTPAQVEISRRGTLHTYTIFPRYDADPTVKRTRVGFEFGPVVKSVGVATAASQSVNQMWQVTTATVSTLGRLFEPKVRSQVHGIVGGFTVTEQRFSFSSTEAFYTLALISLSLAVINLFPFLPLDGGHVFWALAEKVRGRKIPFAVMERAGVVGFVLVLLIFVIGLSNDISTLAGPGFPVR
jgi:regulator of sigma E protease